MAATFVFIDNATIDRGARRSIRSHVMKGKNIGKVRVPKRRLPRISDDVASYNLQCSSDSHTNHQGCLKRGFPLSHGVSDTIEIFSPLVARPGNELSSLASPFEITAQDRRSIYTFLDFVRDAVYPAEFCKDRPDPSLTIWFEYVLIDKAFFHSFIAMSEACMDFVTDRQSQLTPYSRHLTSALRLINGNLSSRNALDDTNLATVIFLCLLSSLREQPLQTKLHFDGLCYMIKARGGVDEFTGNPGIIQKARRIDIDLALQLGSAPVLRKGSTRMNHTSPGSIDKMFAFNSAFIDAISFVEPKILGVALEVAELAQLLKSSTIGNKIDGYTYEDTVTATCYHLLEIRPIKGSSCNMLAKDAAIYLILLSFMTTLLFQFGRQRYLRYELLCRNLKQAFECSDIEATMDTTFRLWFLTIAGISVITKGDYSWLKLHLSQVSEQLGCRDWESVHCWLEKYPWISSVHDRPAFHLWRDCFTLV